MRDNLIMLIEHIDNQRGLFEHVMTNLEAGVPYNGNRESRADRAAEIVYRAVCQEFGILPVGSDEWLGNQTERENFKNMFIRGLISSPDDDNAGWWREVGMHYMNRLDGERQTTAAQQS